MLLTRGYFTTCTFIWLFLSWQINRGVFFFKYVVWIAYTQTLKHSGRSSHFYSVQFSPTSNKTHRLELRSTISTIYRLALCFIGHTLPKGQILQTTPHYCAGYPRNFVSRSSPIRVVLPKRLKFAIVVTIFLYWYLTIFHVYIVFYSTMKKKKNQIIGRYYLKCRTNRLRVLTKYNQIIFYFSTLCRNSSKTSINKSHGNKHSRYLLYVFISRHLFLVFRFELKLFIYNSVPWSISSCPWRVNILYFFFPEKMHFDYSNKTKLPDIIAVYLKITMQIIRPTVLYNILKHYSTLCEPLVFLNICWQQMTITRFGQNLFKAFKDLKFRI